MTGVMDLSMDECIRPWTEDRCEDVTKFLKGSLVSFFNHQFCDEDEPEYSDQNFLWITGCRADKYSMHVIAPDDIYDRGYISCKYLTWEFSRYLWVEGWKALLVELRIPDRDTDRGRADQDRIRMLVRVLKLHKQICEAGDWRATNNTMVDESINSRNRNLRMVGGCKPNTSHMRLLEEGELHLGERVPVGKW